MTVDYSQLFGRSRGVLMKVAPILSMGDISRWGGGGFGRYLTAVGQLPFEVPVMGPALVDAVLERELGARRGSFAEFDPVPFTAASIGQVHRALLGDGRQVAVKIQYPGAAAAINADLSNGELVATFLRMATASTAFRGDVASVARAVAERVREELDYRSEGACVAAFGELYREHPFIRIPQLVPEASAEHVVTLTYFDGLDWGQAQGAGQELKNSWAESIVRFAYSNRWLAGLLHLDPHPDNYRFFSDGSVGFLDFGCVHTLSDEQRSAWFTMIRAAIDGRPADLRAAMGRAGWLEADPTLTAEELHRWWSEMLADLVAETQPVTYTEDHCVRAAGNLFDFGDENHPLARISYTAEAVFTGRVQLNLVSICAGLQACLPIRAIADDSDGVAGPVTARGRQHHAWLARHGHRLPPAGTDLAND